MNNTIIIKPFSTSEPRSLSATSNYMSDLKNEGAKIPVDEHGSMCGSFNCMSGDRAGQLQEMDELLTLYNNPNSTQAAQHGVMTYPSGCRPSRKEIVRDLKILLKKMGMSDHQFVWDAHDNTNNFHVHFLLCRVSPIPDKNGNYHLRDNGIVKVTRTDKKRNRVRTRTDEAACRQAAISEINEYYGFSSGNLTHSKDGTPTPTKKEKDRHTDKTRAGERKSGKQSRERQLSQVIKEVFDIAATKATISQESFWHIADVEFASRAIEMTIKTEDGKAIGGYVVGPGNRKCSFGKAGKEYTTPKLIQRFGPPQPGEEACVNEYEFQPFEYADLITMEEAKKRLIPAFKNAKDWHQLINDIEHLNMQLARSGGGLAITFNNGRDSTTASHVNNKFSLFYMEKILGPCPLPKNATQQPTKRDSLVQEAQAIIEDCVNMKQGLYFVQPALQAVGIKLVKKDFKTIDGELKNYFAIERYGISVPLSKIAQTQDGKPITMYLLKKMDENHPVVRHQQWLKWVESQLYSNRPSFHYLDSLSDPHPHQAPRYLPGVPLLTEIKHQILRGYHHVSRFIAKKTAQPTEQPGTTENNMGHSFRFGQ